MNSGGRALSPQAAWQPRGPTAAVSAKAPTQEFCVRIRDACPARLELATCGLEDRCSIQLSYGHIIVRKRYLCRSSEDRKRGRMPCFGNCMIHHARFHKAHIYGGRQFQAGGGESFSGSQWPLLCLREKGRQADEEEPQGQGPQVGGAQVEGFPRKGKSSRSGGRTKERSSSAGSRAVRARRPPREGSAYAGSQMSQTFRAKPLFSRVASTRRSKAEGTAAGKRSAGTQNPSCFSLRSNMPATIRGTNEVLGGGSRLLGLPGEPFRRRSGGLPACFPL